MESSRLDRRCQQLSEICFFNDPEGLFSLSAERQSKEARSVCQPLFKSLTQAPSSQNLPKSAGDVHSKHPLDCCSIQLLFNDLNTLRFHSVRIGKLGEPDPKVNRFMTGQSKKISAVLRQLRPSSAEKEVLDKSQQLVNCFLNYLLYIYSIESGNGLIKGEQSTARAIPEESKMLDI